MISTAITASQGTRVGMVFQKHGIHIGIGAPIMQIQELAMAINLAGRHEVSVEYRASRGSPGGHELWVGHKPDGRDWITNGQNIIAPLPNVHSTQQQRIESIVGLVQIVEELSAILAEGEPS